MKPLFSEKQKLVVNALWSPLNGGYVTVEKDGIRYTKDKKGKDVLECFVYMVRDFNQRLHYFMEHELNG